MNRPLIHMRELTFWHYQVAGWMIFFMEQVFLGYVFRRLPFWFLLFALGETCLGFLMSLALRAYFRRVRYQEIPILSTIVKIAACSILFALLWTCFSVGLQVILRGPESLVSGFSARWALQTIAFIFPIPFGWSMLYFGIKLWRDWVQEKQHAEKANALAQKAQLQMLRYQLNPHFLFNSLNSIRALILEDTRHAKEMITELSEFLRYSLLSRNRTTVPLIEELEAIRHYLAIEKKRYEDKLDVTFQIDPSTADYPILSFLIHPLVENAMKYGMQTSYMPLRIWLKTELENENLRVSVINSGQWLQHIGDESQHCGTGTGLENIRARLANAYPGRHRIEQFEEHGNVHVLIEVTQDLNEHDEKETYSDTH